MDLPLFEERLAPDGPLGSPFVTTEQVDSASGWRTLAATMRRPPFELGLLLTLAACGGGGGAPSAGRLDAFETARILVDDVVFEVWLARTPAEHAQGLTAATEADLAPLPDGTPRGMLFVFPTASQLAFWMRDTAVPLDLAYARTDGTIVEIFDLVPFDEIPVEASEPVAYALEARAGTFAGHAVGPGSVVVP